jgi:hypothetical protein
MTTTTTTKKETKTNMSISKPNARARAQERLAKSSDSEFTLEAGADSPAPAPADTVTGDAPKRRGRKPGSKNKPKLIERTPEEKAQGAAACSFMVATVWDIFAPAMKRRTLSDQEAQAIGGALDPVLAKYLPGMAGYVLEINLCVIVLGIWQTTKLPKELTPETKAGKKEKPKLEMVE